MGLSQSSAGRSAITATGACSSPPRPAVDWALKTNERLSISLPPRLAQLGSKCLLSLSGFKGHLQFALYGSVQKTNNQFNGNSFLVEADRNGLYFNNSMIFTVRGSSEVCVVPGTKVERSELRF